VVGRPCGSLVLPMWALSILKCAWKEHKARQGLSNWYLLQGWAYKARRVPHGVRARTLRMVCSGQAGGRPSQCYVASMSEELTLTHGVRARTLQLCVIYSSRSYKSAKNV